MGICTKAGRIAINHKNVPNMLSQLTGVLAALNINISDMASKSKGDYAYTILDLDDVATAEAVSKIQALDGVIKVRIVK